MRASPAVNLDETGWRQDGRNGYVWTASTPTACRFRYGTRHKGLVDTLRGAAFSGTLVSDFSAAYAHDPGRKQTCWAHLLREAQELTVVHPQDHALRRWVDRRSRLYRAATAVAAPVADQPERVRVRAQQRLADRRRRRAAAAPAAPTAVLARLGRRILRQLSALLVFVAMPGVPAGNTGAERSLRHLVTARKTSGGSRSPRGTATKLVLASLFETWRRQGHHPCDQTRALRLPHQP